MTRLITFFIAFLLVSTSVFTQMKLDYDKDSKWFLGFNFGGTWHTTDVNYRPHTSYGYGLTLGKSFNYDYGKKISFDIRGRYLQGAWYGQDLKTSSINSSYTGFLADSLSNYKAVGYTVNNFKVDVRRLGLELVIHANGLRERSGWDPYIFGGIGVTWHRTASNLINSNSTLSPLYAYDTTVNYTTSSINALLDKSYETVIDGNTNSSFTASFMPSLGFGLGYQISKRVSIGLEHKSTFTMADNFDGVVQVGKYKQDIYHYTSGYIRFQLRSHKNETVAHTNPVIPPVVAPTVQLPVVKYITPAVTKTTVNSANYLLVAEVNNVNGRENIVFKQEGIANSNFTYNATTDRLESNVVLKLGENTFEITGTNSVGSDVESTIVIYNRDSGTPPIVTITNPNSNSISVSNPVFALTSTVLNVQNASQVSVVFNGQTITNFQYNALTNGVNSTLNLVNGENTVTIKGVNSFGSDSKTVKIVYTKPTVLAPPVVTFVVPNISPFTSVNASITINATVLNVAAASGVSVSLNNGVSISNFTFNPTTSLVTFPLSLKEGSNTITIKGTNVSGTDSKTQVIIYNKPVAVVPPPVVTFVTPNATPYTSTTPVFNVSATVLNVSSKSGIAVKFNGNNISNFTFDLSTTMVSFPCNLLEGSNTVVITGTNATGTDTKTQSIIYNKPVVIAPPVVTFINPASSGLFVTAESFSMVATVLNVNNISQVTLSKDGNLVNAASYTFDPNTKKVTFNTGLMAGNNVFTVTGTNTGGTDSKTTTVIYRKQEVIAPPVVTFINPASSGLFVTAESFSMVATVLNVNNISQVTLSKDGNLVNAASYTFDPNTKKVTFNTGLMVGNNVFTVTGTNTGGTDSKTTTVIYRKPVAIPAPVVTFINPNTSPFTINASNASITATVLNVSSSNDISVTVNGNSIANFTFLSSTSMVSFTSVLNEGSNSIVITGTNTSGSDTKTQIIIYNKPVVLPKPIVNFLNPASSGLIKSEEAMAISASVLNVDNVAQIEVSKDGQIVNAGQYSFNTTTKKVTFNTVLIEGSNVFTVKGTNVSGTDTKTTTVVFKKPTPPCVGPTMNVTSISDVDNSITSKPYFNLTAITSEIIDDTQITTTHDGKVLAHTFDPGSHTLSLNDRLPAGLNVFVVKLVNNCGTKIYTYNITYKKELAFLLPTAPKIVFSNPAATPHSAPAGKMNIVGNVSNVNAASTLKITVNGVEVTNYNPVQKPENVDFNFDVMVEALSPIKTIVVTSTNIHGTTTETIVVNYSASGGGGRIAPNKGGKPEESVPTPTPIIPTGKKR
jgi:hypothetical protein